ncbi:hypothetical protein SETIT_9G201600v2 [Setaria italica]|uniref:Uncharacterized protein n=1 Tax=Setaria italica TaxID=4555 RepID=A0A368SKA9_SETIT|nr:hypothetical protein SETIT_9G201600v2 [Setaria italica]
MQAAALKEAAGRLLDSVGAAGTCKTVTSTCALLADYINKACALATRLGILDTPLAFRNEASSGPRKTAAAPTIPVSTVFNRITGARHPTCEREGNVSVAEYFGIQIPNQTKLTTGSGSTLFKQSMFIRFSYSNSKSTVSMLCGLAFNN